MIYTENLPEPFTDVRMWYLISFYTLHNHQAPPANTLGDIPFMLDGKETVLEVRDYGEQFNDEPPMRGWPLGKRYVQYRVDGLFTFVVAFDTSQNKYHMDHFISAKLETVKGVTIEEVQHHMTVWKLMAPWPLV